ncbi:hypothetical protein [Bacillus cereus]|uniref:Uncharacterized protein n=1 Tax=Bacillus cereus TaxID=1396 RepID=A0A164QDM3_BACCE|nr:hypothetical protein [Bacillus cereus]KZD71166.1 hypothetical protein B4088_0896 [Bacillus cereus]
MEKVIATETDFCPYCGHIHDLLIKENAIKKTTINGTLVSHKQTYTYCPVSDEEFFKGTQWNETLQNIQNALKIALV